MGTSEAYNVGSKALQLLSLLQVHCDLQVMTGMSPQMQHTLTGTVTPPCWHLSAGVDMMDPNTWFDLVNYMLGFGLSIINPPGEAAPKHKDDHGQCNARRMIRTLHALKQCT